MMSEAHPWQPPQVLQAPTAESILPPKERSGDSLKRRFLYDTVLERLRRVRGQLPALSDAQLDYLVRKGLLYVMRGCDKMPQQGHGHGAAAGNAPPCNIVFNYLPEGLREMENRQQAGIGSVEEEDKEAGETASLWRSEKKRLLEEGVTPKSGPASSLAPEERESTDPLNSILNPNAATATATSSHKRVLRPNELPLRKYLTGCVHAEWVVVKGRPQVYEISVYMADMSSLSVYMVPDDLRRQTATLDNLGFVANPDRAEFYFVQVGVGCVKALSTDKGLERLAQFLEEKRNHRAGSENANGGLVLTFYSEEELSVVLRLLESGGQKSLLLDTVKGFGCIANLVEEAGAEKALGFSGPKLEIGGDDCFYHSEVRAGGRTSNLVSKSKGESLSQALEFFLGGAPTYRNFVQPHCFPALSPRADEVRRRLRQAEELYTLEVFMASELKQQRAPLFLEGAFAPLLGKDLRDKATVVAGRVCRLLVRAGFHKEALAKAFATNPDYAIHSSVLLEQEGTGQRLKVMDQTMRCLAIVRDYFVGRRC